jgi:hypothetical protein
MKFRYTVTLWASIDNMRGQARPRWRVSRPLAWSTSAADDCRIIDIIDVIADRDEAFLNQRYM